MQALAPTWLAYVLLTAHATHAVWPIPAPAVAEPASHCRHAVCPAWPWYVPGPHAAQLALTVELHSPVKKLPAPQSPATHALHAVRPTWSWYVPPLQLPHTWSAAGVQGACWYWPTPHSAAHAWQAVRPVCA